MMISLTEEHIKSGVRKSYSSCPIALALTAAIPAELQPVRVLPTAVVYRWGRWSENPVRVSLPNSAQKFIRDFDDDDGEITPQPFSFEVELPGKASSS